MSRPRAFGARMCSSHAACLLRPRLDRNGWPPGGPVLPPRMRTTTTCDAVEGPDAPFDRTWLVFGRRTLSGHVCHSAHHFGGTQCSIRGGSGSNPCSTTGKVDTSCPTTSAISVQAGCTAPPARRSHDAAGADAADAGPEPARVRQARAARSSRPAGPPTGYPDVRRPTR